MAYIGKSPSVGIRDRFYYTTVGGETSISGADDAGRTLVFTDGKYVDVMLNGITLVAGTDYVTTTTNTISGLDSLGDSDVVEIVVYDVFSIADTVSASRGGTFNGPVTFTDSVQGATITANFFIGDGSQLTNVASAIADLNDVDSAMSPTNNQVLVYNGTEWTADSIDVSVDGGSATSLYLAIQSINGGGASG